jgi:hypothetical protein
VVSFEAPIEEGPRGGAYVEVPPDVASALGGKGRILVTATFDGVPYRGSIMSMSGPPILGILKQIRQQLGKSAGDLVTVTVDVDRSERSVTVPHDLAAALVAAGLFEAFDSLSYTQRREYVTWIVAAKRPETRERRVNQTIERLQR